ncbi:hypothetical protein V6Z12_D07G126200 [Gossypium hirsutum]
MSAVFSLTKILPISFKIFLGGRKSKDKGKESVIGVINFRFALINFLYMCLSFISSMHHIKNKWC